MERFKKVAEEGLENAVMFSKEGLVFDTEGMKEKIKEALEREFKEMEKYMGSVEEKEKQEKREKEEMIIFDENLRKRIEELYFLPDEILDALAGDPELLDDPEIRKQIGKVVYAFFRPIPWHEYIKNHLDSIVDIRVYSAAMTAALRERIKDPEVRKKIEKTLGEIEKEEKEEYQA